MTKTSYMKLRGSQYFRQRLLLSTLSLTPILVEDIRTEETSPGLQPYEVSLLHLLEKISDDCSVEINETGTKLKYKPGVLIGGKHLVHDCGLSRSVGYFLEPLIVLGLFGKRPLSIRLKGITSDSKDPSVDTFRTTTLHMFKHFGVPLNGLELKIESRGAAPLGGGEVVLGVPMIPTSLTVSVHHRGVSLSLSLSLSNTHVHAHTRSCTHECMDRNASAYAHLHDSLSHFKCMQATSYRWTLPLFLIYVYIHTYIYLPHISKQMHAHAHLHRSNSQMLKQATTWIDEGMVKRIRGVTFSTRVSPQFGNRMVSAARGVFNRFLPDVHIFTDHRSGESAGRSPGYGISLVAETTTGCLISADSAVSYPKTEVDVFNNVEEKPELMPPEDVGTQVACVLLGEIEQGGVVDSSHQGLLFLLCALCPPDVSKVRVGKLTPHSIGTLRNIRDFLGVKFVIKPESTTNTVILKCVGCGLKNLSRKIS